MSGNYVELRAQLVQMRKHLGIKQEAVARRMGVSQPDVSRVVEHGDPSIPVLERYVEALGGRLEVYAVAGDNRLGNRWPVETLPSQDRIPRPPL